MLRDNSSNTKTLPSTSLDFKGHRYTSDHNTFGKYNDQIPSTSSSAPLFQDDDYRFRTITPRLIKRERKATKKTSIKRARKNKNNKKDTTLQEISTDKEQRVDDLQGAPTDKEQHADDLQGTPTDKEQRADDLQETVTKANDTSNLSDIPTSTSDKILKQEDQDEIWEIHVDPFEEETWKISDYHTTKDTYNIKQTEWNKEPESTPITTATTTTTTTTTNLSFEIAHKDFVEKDEDESDCSSIIDLCSNKMEILEEWTPEEEMMIDEDRFYDALDLQSSTNNDSDTSEDYLSPFED